MLADMTANPAAMRAALATGFPTATDLADYLVRELGLPFREAHHVSGTIVAMATDADATLTRCRLPTCSPSSHGSPRPSDVLPARRRGDAASFGGTAPDEVRARIAEARQRYGLNDD